HASRGTSEARRYLLLRPDDTRCCARGVARTRRSLATHDRGHRVNIDLNADVGEGADDAPLYDVVSSVNIACGAHAGDDDSMARAIERAVKRPISIGAHPGYPDRENMGRKQLDMQRNELRVSIRDQIARLR